MDLISYDISLSTHNSLFLRLDFNNFLKLTTLRRMSDSNVCYKCRNPGHFARECKESGATPERRTERRSGGGEGGSWKRSGGGGSSNSRCYRCNRNGHLARDCEEASERCYRCNQPGHLAMDIVNLFSSCF